MRAISVAVLLDLVLIFGSAPALGQADAGGCGNVTAQGSCDDAGTLRTFCNTTSNMVETVDCTMDSPTRHCVEINPTHGTECAQAPGVACEEDDGTGHLISVFCYGMMPGCLDTKEDQVCSEQLPPCTSDQVGSCMGQRLIKACLEGQPWLLDCNSYGGMCGDHACRDVELGSFCDNVDFYCRTGARCLLGSCFPSDLGDSGILPPPRDASSGEDDASADADAGVPNGNTGGDDKSGCGCATARERPSSPLLFVFALLGLAIGRRYFFA